LAPIITYPKNTSRYTSRNFSFATTIARIPIVSGRLLQDAEASSLAGTSAAISQTNAASVPISERKAVRKEDEEFLKRVAKEQPELLDAGSDEQDFNDVLKRLIHASPAPKQKKRRKANRAARSKRHNQ
jgi:hypothetical protein